MAGPGLRTDNDARFGDSELDPSAKEHQQVHDRIAPTINSIDIDSPRADGQVMAWSAASQLAGADDHRQP